MSSILLKFPPLPPPGFSTTCESNGELCHRKEETASKHILSNYPVIDVSKDSLHSSSSHSQSARSAFLPHKDSLVKNLAEVWHEHGLSGVLEELSTNRKQVPKWVSLLAYFFLAIFNWITSIPGYLYPHLAMTQEEMISEFSMARDWNNSAIKAFAWHPQINKCAVVLKNDNVKVYSSENSTVPLLKHKLQKGVSDVAWQPQSSSILAVACQTCVLIWHLDPNSLSTRPPSNLAQVLSRWGHAPVTSLAWCPQLPLLVTSSVASTSVLVWDAVCDKCHSVRRRGGGGVPRTAWSPDGSRLYATTPSSILRVYESRKWSCEKWSNLSGRCTTACWSPDSRTLLFAMTLDPAIYSLSFDLQPSPGRSSVGGSKAAIRCADLSEVVLTWGQETTTVGGSIQQMVWDEHGERLAVLFRGNEETDNSALHIAIFITRLNPILELLPCGFVQGEFGDSPQLIAFQPKFRGGSLLTICWKSGKVTHVPLYYMSMHGHNNVQQRTEFNMKYLLHSS